jgi:hypothetical protein
MTIETKYYADGSSATGPAPMPNVSPSGSPEVPKPGVPQVPSPAVPTTKEQDAAAQRNADIQAAAEAKKAENKVVLPSDFEGRTITGFNVYKRASVDIVEIEHASGPTYLKFRHGLHQVSSSMDWDENGQTLEAADKPKFALKTEYPKAMFKGDPTKPDYHIETVPDLASEKLARKDGFIDGVERTAKYAPAKSVQEPAHA